MAWRERQRTSGGNRGVLLQARACGIIRGFRSVYGQDVAIEIKSISPVIISGIAQCRKAAPKGMVFVNPIGFSGDWVMRIQPPWWGFVDDDNAAARTQRAGYYRAVSVIVD